MPLVYFCDCPGFLIGLEAEKSGVIRHGVRAMSAMFQGTVPWCTFIIRNAFGVAGALRSGFYAGFRVSVSQSFTASGDASTPCNRS